MSCRIYSTFVGWDLDDYPLPKGLDPRLIDQTIRSAVDYKGFVRGYTQIQAYSNSKNRVLSRKAKRILGELGTMFVNILDHRSARVTKMLVDMLVWALNTRQPVNFIVITKISERTEFLIRSLLSLKERGNNVFLALPDMSVSKHLANSIEAILTRTNVDFLKLTHAAPGYYDKIQVWVCPNLFETQWWEEEEEEEEVVLPKLTNFSMDSKPGDGKTTVFWDVMDYPPPADLDSTLFYEKIKVEKGYLGDLFIWAYVPDDGSPVPPNYHDLDDRFKLVPNVPGDKHARLNKMTLDLLLWAIDNPVQRPRGPHLIVIAKNKKENSDFYCILEGLPSRPYSVCLALPDDAPQEALEEAKYIVTLGLPWKSLLSQ